MVCSKKFTQLVSEPPAVNIRQSVDEISDVDEHNFGALFDPIQVPTGLNETTDSKNVVGEVRQLELLV